MYKETLETAIDNLSNELELLNDMHEILEKLLSLKFIAEDQEVFINKMRQAPNPKPLDAKLLNLSSLKKKENKKKSLEIDRLRIIYDEYRKTLDPQMPKVFWTFKESGFAIVEEQSTSGIPVCFLCGNQIDNRREAFTLECGHTFDVECLKKIVKKSIRTRKVLQCPGCISGFVSLFDEEKLIGRNFLKLSLAETKQYREVRVIEISKNNPSLTPVFCLNPSCGNVFLLNFSESYDTYARPCELCGRPYTSCPYCRHRILLHDEVFDEECSCGDFPTLSMASKARSIYDSQNIGGTYSWLEFLEIRKFGFTGVATRVSEDGILETKKISESRRSYRPIVSRFFKTWGTTSQASSTVDKNKISVVAVFRARNKDLATKYSEYVDELVEKFKIRRKKDTKIDSQLRDRIENVRYLWHGTSMNCELADQFQCGKETCAVCNILKTGFRKSRAELQSGKRKALKFGEGIYFASQSDKSHVYNRESEIDLAYTKLRVILFCKVALGREKQYRSKFAQHLTEAPEDYDSVHGLRSERLASDEFVVYDERAALPMNIIVYSYVSKD